ncbi:hypothetical protein [Devosia sp. MC1541]|uniref:hypothetical protein n=1 Tax=Devosia sp. MC1541 TaxID=2725264 RepID=UPI00145D005D|nr:hypothetical protein [Devosia sp. MC1541]
MERHSVRSLDGLKEVIALYGSDSLFRGQVRQYEVDGAPIINTSFSRNGCIPPLMLRWSHYSSFILAALLGQDQRSISLEFTQAVLQHYGWRSFYLDASVSPAVSAWFASHVFSGKRSMEICEDCFEDPLFLVKFMANYSYEEGTGYLYVLSKQALAKCGHGLVDLSSIEMEDCRPRFHAQRAWLVGPLHGNLPSECILAIIEAPRVVFKELSNEAGFVETSDLFPRIDEDPVLELLTSMPWKKIKIPGEKGDDGLQFFDQPFEFPEYHDSFRKHNPPHIAYYDGKFSPMARMTEDIAIYDVPEIVVYGFADPVSTKFPRVAELLQQDERHFIFEIDTLVRRPGRLSQEYLKGVAVSKAENGLLSVADFVVEHPGLQMHGCGVNMGWHYKIVDDGSWHRVVTKDDCPCNNNSIHEHHLSMLTIIEDQLTQDPTMVARRQFEDMKENSIDV